MGVGRLRDKLILASLILIIPFLAWNFLLETTRFHEEYSEAISSGQESARSVSAEMLGYIHNVVAVERTVGIEFWGTNQMPKAGISGELKTVRASFPSLKHMCALNADGIAIAGDIPQVMGTNLSDHPSVLKVRRGADWAVSNVYRPTADNKQVFDIVTGIWDKNGRLRGMVMARLDEASLASPLKHDVNGSEELIVTDSTGTVALSLGVQKLSSQQRNWSGLPFVRCALSGKPANADNLRIPNGEVMIGSAVPVPELGWTAAVFRSRDEVMAPVRGFALWSGALALVLTLLFAGTAYYLGNNLTRPVTDLTNAACAFGRGDLSARAHVRTHDEIELLALSFNDMADALQMRTTELNTALSVERHQAERIAALYSVAQGIAATIDLDQRLRIIARALASILHAGRCAIFLKTGNRLVAATGWNLVRLDIFRELSYDLDASDQVMTKALIEGASSLVRDVATDPHIRSKDKITLAELGVKGFFALPLVWKHRLVGIATLDNPERFPDFEEEDMESARDLADLAASAIENSQVFEKEKNIAYALQHSLLTDLCGRVGGYDIACEYHAALEVALLGGDLYDVIEFRDGRIGIVIADVSGKGLEAAVFTAMSKYTLRAFASEDPSPGATLHRTNNSLMRVGEEWGFVTLAYSLLDPQTGTITAVNAGHPPCIIVRASGETVELRHPAHSLPLGIMNDTNYGECGETLNPGDVFVGYTDGVVEARHNGELYEIDRLAALVRESRHLSADEIAHAIYESVLEYSRGSMQDDVAVVVVKRDAA